MTIWESERGWGRSHFQDVDFDSFEAAEAKYKAVNAANNLPQTPDYYIFADPPRLVDVERNPPRG